MTWASRAQPGDRPSVPCPVLSGIIHPVNPGVTASESTLLQSFRVIFYYFRPSPSRWLRLHTEGFSGTVTFQIKQTTVPVCTQAGLGDEIGGGCQCQW